mgnify:CR=1 FL=1
MIHKLWIILYDSYISYKYLIKIVQMSNLTSAVDRDVLDTINLKQFLQDTRPFYKINSCMFNSYDCRNDWKLISTLFGMCLTLNPNKFKSFDPIHSLMFAFDQDDADTTVGWKTPAYRNDPEILENLNIPFCLRKKWPQKMTPKNDCQKWLAKITTKNDSQKWTPKMTLKNWPEKIPQKMTPKNKPQKWPSKTDPSTI